MSRDTILDELLGELRARLSRGTRDLEGELARAVAFGEGLPAGRDKVFDFPFIEALIHAAAGIEALGQIRLADIEIKGGAPAQLNLEFLRQDKGLLLLDCLVEGDLILTNAQLEELDLSGTTLDRLLGKSLQVNGNLLLEGSRVRERVDLESCSVGGNLSFNKAKLSAATSDAKEEKRERGPVAQGDPRTVRRESYRRDEMVFLWGARIAGSLRFSGAGSNRKIRMTNAHVEGDVDLWGASFTDDGKEENGLIATNCQIGEKFIITNVTFSENSRLALDYSRVRVLQAERDSVLWPRAQHLSLEGFFFDALTFPQRQTGAETTVFDEELTIAWLKRNGPAFYRQPWLHAARSFRDKGYRSEATKIMIAMEKESDRVERAFGPGERARPGLIRRTASRLIRSLWWFADYGHRPQKVLWPIVILILANAVTNYVLIKVHPAAFVTQSQDIMMAEHDPDPNSLPEHPLFDSLTFAIDTFVPGLEFGQETAWQPNWHDQVGRFYALYLYLFHMTAGLVLTGVLVAGVTKKLTEET